MSAELRSTTSARDRLLLAGAHLLDESGGGEVSTRAICELAGVQAPTLYHHFDSKQGLLDAVVSHGFRQFLSARRAFAVGGDGDPIADIREGWDSHVQFGLEHPAFYAQIYGSVRPGEPCGVVSEVEAMILQTLEPAARRGRLTVSPADAAAEILAASSGVILTLITRPRGSADLGLSQRVRDAVLDAVTTDPGDAAAARPRDEPTVASAAIALAAALDDAPTPLSASETALLRDWLGRLGSR
ncbi:TetR/AcrR family transcriptional regulator [Conexibacter sp. CPCC 206217]|uniref:TetR/AcrR family transcriptional regulator n=1 Tax=Conexibacter sp. CPCC 206217 TaxID=3064574 RepID=UPI002721B24D|nr:TetR/AcrR family transcriptional regulator [Conexibacter sp. CPCC 206217]MDO8214154.1 TetR/AcrR family transcriptional regulator [Conexibacter sp. CPCC 206217]